MSGPPITRLVIATHNAGKLREFRTLFAAHGFDLVSAGDLGLPEPEETGTSFVANALLKAEAAAKGAGLPALADDSGLCVDALDGDPGIYSARWAGKPADFSAAMARIGTLLDERGARAADQRRAHFVAALALVWPDGTRLIVEGKVFGTLVAPRGTLGFGYDPMFVPDGHARTFGEMSAEEKHGIPADGSEALSHRARAFQMLERRLAGGRCPMIADKPGDFGVYVHWPFCLSKCPYCDFNSHVRSGAVDEARYLAAFRTELAHRAAEVPGRRVHSIFFGGGTPSLMKPATVAGILDAIAGHWAIEPGAEVTLEANPTSVEAERFRGYRAAGVNRVSLGVQALNDADLKALGRLHSVAEAMAAVATAASIFDRSSFDLIYARPGQTPAQWAAELEGAIDRAAEHLSLYQLTIEPDTMFERLHRAGKLKTPDEETGRALWDVTQEITEKHGLPAYEISNHARPGAESRHNLVYWRYGDYAGVGPGAHGRLTTAAGRRAHSTERHPEMWLTTVETEGHGLVCDEGLSAEEQGDEFLLMGLRLREGIDPDRFAMLAGRSLDAQRIGSLIEDGFVERTAEGRLRVTQAGFPVLDAVVADLAA